MCNVTCILQSISPGAVKTEFMARSDGRDDIEASKKEYDTMNPYGPVSIVRGYYCGSHLSIIALVVMLLYISIDIVAMLVLHRIATCICIGYWLKHKQVIVMQ